MLNSFGTDGIRGKVGTGIFTREALARLGAALAQWALQKYGNQGTRPQLLITQDTRISSGFVKAALKSGLFQYPITMHDTQTLPTPALAHILQTNPQFHAGIIVSASHNSYEDNGIKIMDAITGKLSSEDEQIILNFFHESAPATDYLQEHAYGSDITFMQAEELYCSRIRALFPENFLENITVVLDTAHGATYHVAPLLFKAFGATVITINNKPDGYNINEQCGALHLSSLQKAVLEHNAAFGFAFDGDGDRVIAVNSLGEIKDGDDILAILLTHPAYCATTTVVGTVMTNEGFAQHVTNQGKKLIRTAVGDKYIAEKLNSHKLLLGGEPSGHIILQDIIYTGDGILVALRTLEAIILTNNWLMHTFIKYPQVMLNVAVNSKKDLGEYPLKTLINQAESGLSTGRILVRYSGTENVLRVMVETDTFHQANHVCQELATNLAKLL